MEQAAWCPPLLSHTHRYVCPLLSFVLMWPCQRPETGAGRKDAALPFSGISSLHSQAVTTARTYGKPQAWPGWGWATSAAQELSDHRGFAGSIPLGSWLLWAFSKMFLLPCHQFRPKMKHIFLPLCGSEFIHLILHHGFPRPEQTNSEAASLGQL